MLHVRINDSDRTSDVDRNSLIISNELQQRADTCNLSLISGTEPSENQDLQIFMVDTIASFAGSTVTLDGNFQSDVGRFFAGQKLQIRIGDSDEEEVTVQSYTESTLQLVLEAAPSGSVSQGDMIGPIVFGGVVSRVRNRNVKDLANLEYDVEGVDYSKLFNKKRINDSWEDVDGRYIINAFVNDTVNHNSTLDDLSYANNGAIQAEWIEAGDGNNPTVDTSDFLEGTSSGVFSWTNAGGTATWEATPTPKNLAELTGVSAGAPTEGELMIWMDPADITKITSFKIRIGSDNGNYAEVTFDVPTLNEWGYQSKKLVSAAITGNPDWTATDYATIVIGENASSSIKLNGIRVNKENSFTLYNTEETPILDDFRISWQEATTVIQTLSKSYDFIWFIDYLRDVHFKDRETDNAHFDLTDTSDNFTNLNIAVDQSQLANRVVVNGGEKTSTSTYAQVFQGDSALREWLMKNKFNNMAITLDDNSTNNAAEVGTTTTNIKVTGHSLVVGDHITNRTRGEVRQILTVVDPDNYTVEAVPAQTNGDTISEFSVAKTSGIEGIVDETTVDYVENSNEKSIRATASEDTLTSSDYIRFAYNERVPIQVLYSDGASITALKSLGLGDGIFDGDTITDRNIKDTVTAITLAQAKIRDFSNPIIEGNFTTDQHGLKAGQIIRIQDSVRGIDDDYMIQRVTFRQSEGEFADYFIYNVTVGTTLFGVIEFYQKLLRQGEGLEVNDDVIIETFATADEEVESADVNLTATDGGFETASEDEVVESADVNLALDFPKGTWRWEPNGVGQTLQTRWNLFDWG